ncbi:MAG: bifunctional pyr operon transcriptional regulator/uracil phosphoribosyltransferase PyrR [Gammaproteobacteria bacterium]|nr:bifunctional pyr operon transcriptional regulator/uracil phosphoribosyltransferase PyrR [Gammaproteobacteria bacterium]
MTQVTDVTTLLDSIASQLRQNLQQRGISDPDLSDVGMIGIHSGGAWVARELHAKLRLKQPLGTLNISFYRDDFTRIGMHPQVQPSELPFDIEDRHIILVDDVLQTGRTIRAALNEIFDYGRPASVTLAVLVKRSGSELPICADVCGTQLDLADNQHIKLTGPDPLELKVHTDS